MHDNPVPLDLRQLSIYGNLEDDDEVMDEDDDNNTTTSTDKFFYRSNYNNKERLFEGFLNNFPSTRSQTAPASKSEWASLAIDVNPWGDQSKSDQGTHQQNSNMEGDDPFLDNNFQAGKNGSEHEDGFQFANFADFDQFCDNNFSSSLEEEDKCSDEVFMNEMNSDKNANIEKISTKDVDAFVGQPLASAQIPASESVPAVESHSSNVAFPSTMNNFSNDDTLDLDGSDSMLNGSYEGPEGNIESNFNM